MSRARLHLVLFAALLSSLGAADTSRAQSVTSGRYGLNQSSSLVAFTIFTQGLFSSKREGRFHDVTGELSYDPGKPADAHIDLVVYTASVDMKNAQHDQLLRSREFFDVDEFPTMRFTSASADIKRDGTLMVFGDLTIRGITKRIAIPVALHVSAAAGSAPAATFETTFNIDRTEFGLNGVPKWNAFSISIAKRVQIHVAIATSSFSAK